MVAHVAHSFAIQIKFRNQKEAMISYGNEVIIKLRSFQRIPDENWISFKIFTLGYEGATDKDSPSVAHT